MEKYESKKGPYKGPYYDPNKTLTEEQFEEMLRNHTFILPEEVLPPVRPTEERVDIDDSLAA